MLSPHLIKIQQDILKLCHLRFW